MSPHWFEAARAGTVEWFVRLVDRGEALLRARGGILVAGALCLLTFTILGSTLGGRTRPDIEVQGTALLLAAALVTTLTVGGVVSLELRQGIALLWIQKAGSPTGYYVGRLLEGISLALLLSLAAAGGQAGVLAILGAEWDHFLRVTVPALLPLVLILAVLTWTVSGAGARGDGTAAILLLLGWLVGGELLASQEGVLALLGEGLRATAPPLEAVEALRQWGRGTQVAWWGTTIRFLVWCSCVMAVGVLVLTARLRRPFPVEQSR